MVETVDVPTFNYLLHPAHTSLVTVGDVEGEANILAIAWIMPVSVKPPLLCMSIRPGRYSYGFIQKSGEFVVNVPPSEITPQVLYCGRRSGREVDKFSKTGLTPKPARVVRAPIIEECMAFMECRVIQEVEAGDHQLMIAEVVEAYAKVGILGEDGLYDLKQAHPIFHVGGDRFTIASDTTMEPKLE
ncbi:MAG: flavin reductase family protein [Chloroflexota bacterium]